MSREMRLSGNVVIVQCDEDPGDKGEPRIVSEDDTTYVFVPAFELWPSAARSAVGPPEGLRKALRETDDLLCAYLFDGDTGAGGDEEFVSQAHDKLRAILATPPKHRIKRDG